MEYRLTFAGSESPVPENVKTVGSEDMEVDGVGNSTHVSNAEMVGGANQETVVKGGHPEEASGNPTAAVDTLRELVSLGGIPSQFAGAEDDVNLDEINEVPEVVITCDNGRMYSCMATNGGYALVFGNTLRERLYGRDWVGSVTVQASGDTSDLSPYVLEGSLVWELASGEYEAHGSGSQTVGSGARSMSEKAGLSRFPASSFSRALTRGARACTTYRTATAASSRSIFSGARCSEKRSTSGAGNAGSPHEEVVSQKRFRVHKPSSLGGLDSADGFSGEVDVSKAGAGFKRPPSPRRRSSYMPEPSLLVTGAKRGSGVFELEEPKAEAGSQPSLVGVNKSSIARSVLGGKMKSYNPLLQLFQKFEELGEELKVVDYMPQPFDGDQIFIRPKCSGLTDRLVDAQHWGKGTNIHPALLGKEQVRLWKCEGGHVCDNEECWYAKSEGKPNGVAFDKTTDGGWYCNWCTLEARSTGDCEAKRYAVKGDTDIAHVHVGKHNHAINVAVSQEIRERFAAHAIRAAAKIPT
jgi:hypothetical protein